MENTEAGWSVGTLTKNTNRIPQEERVTLAIQNTEIEVDSVTAVFIGKSLLSAAKFADQLNQEYKKNKS